MTPSTPAQAAPGTTPMSAGTVVFVLSLLLGIQPVTTDLYLPALPAITSGFGATLSQAQLTLTGMLLAFGLSQMVWGPLSDRVGRRPVLLAGLGLYVLAAVGALLASSMEWLIVWRVLQGAAMGAAVMAGRAIVRDLYAPEEGARVLSKALSGLGVIAALSAPVGSWLASTWGWRAALGALAVFSGLALLVVATRFKETLAQRKPQATQLRVMLANWRRILAHPTFWTYSLLATVSYAGLFTFLGASSFVFIDVLGLSRVNYGWTLFTMANSYLAGTFLCRYLLRRIGVQRAVRVGGFITLAGGSVLGLLPHLGLVHPLAVLLPFCVFMVGHGIHQPCGQSGSVGPFPDAAGAASALSGLMMMLVAFGVGSWLGRRLDGTVFALTNGIWFWAVCIAAVAWLLVPRFGAATTTPPKRVA
ncbi:MAG: multidrug effflux MFS transporter [Burkholderiaceae bacterium]|nr:multidrug effflux MFS transporter [Burkholderiaceae bacterium]MDZ4163220.1 multidrug effflux MFS transporter [Burkholderiales bacterium]